MDIETDFGKHLKRKAAHATDPERWRMVRLAARPNTRFTRCVDPLFFESLLPERAISARLTVNKAKCDDGNMRVPALRTMQASPAGPVLDRESMVGCLGHKYTL